MGVMLLYLFKVCVSFVMYIYLYIFLLAAYNAGLFGCCWGFKILPPNASPRMLSHHSDPFPPYGGLMVHLKILF